MNPYPKLFIEKVTDIHIGLLKELNIKGIIVDLDNTLIDYEENLLSGAEKWCKDLKGLGISFCIVTNSGGKEKVTKVANALDIPYIMYAKKPFTGGYLKAKTLMGLPNRSIAVVGDQLLTDILGANNLNMYSILVEPIDPKEMILTKIRRPIERGLLKKHFNKRSK